MRLKSSERLALAASAANKRRGALPPALEPIDNTHKVAKRQWKKWSEKQRRAFNQLFELFRDHQELFKHPAAPLIEQKHWDTTAWNAAWMGAEEAK